jgi:transcriptional regulator with XRE-family HTH domain
MTRDIRPELTEFGLRLRELRGRRDLTQEQLAHLAGVDRAWISSAETGRRNATLTTLYRLAEALSVDPGELLIGTSSTPKNR